MDDTELAERIHELQVSLKDGDDLARAIGLIGDALERRILSIRDGLHDLREDGEVPDGERLEEIIARVGETLDAYEERIEERRQRMEDLVDEFQSSLGEQAQELNDLEADLKGIDRDEQDHLPSSGESRG